MTLFSVYLFQDKTKRFFEELGCKDIDFYDNFSNFYFTRTRKSLEHYYPQAKAVNENPANKPELLTHQNINCFGNFAMIGSEANSTGQDWYPIVKYEAYSDDKKIDAVSVASLKFIIMMQICNKNQNNNRPRHQEWIKDDMNNHQNKMLDILFSNELCIE